MSGTEVVTVQQQEAGPETAIIAMIERVALDPNSDVARLEKMLDMQERILNRNARMEFDAAMADMQAELPEVEKLAKAKVMHKGGGSHEISYAKFETILSAIKPVLLKYGFSITHRVSVNAQEIKVTAILSHRGGHREETSIVLPPDMSGGKNAVQAVGSTVEYGRRYTMNTLLGIATKDADTDGSYPAVVSEDRSALDAAIAKIGKARSLKSIREAAKAAWDAYADLPGATEEIQEAVDAAKAKLAAAKQEEEQPE